MIIIHKLPIEWSRLEYVQGHNEGVAVRPEVLLLPETAIQGHEE